MHKLTLAIFAYDPMKQGRLSASELYASETRAMASEFEYSDFEGWMCTGGDDRSLILETGANKYHIRPQPIDKSAIFRG